jgi:hypothetical protein
MVSKKCFRAESSLFDGRFRRVFGLRIEAESPLRNTA